MTIKSGMLVIGLLPLLGLACEPTAPANPTWADVQPIVRSECSSCHGATASVTGAGNRFDFYDMSPELCGQAAQVLDPNLPLAHGLAGSMWNAISTTPDQAYTRPMMPPEPAPFLADWEWQTIKNWVDNNAVKGLMPPGNTPARIQLYGDMSTADASLDVTAVVDDADGDPVVGILTFGNAMLKMDRSGSFSAHIDTSTWPEGPRTIGTVLCDGWSSVHYELGTLTIAHAH